MKVDSRKLWRMPAGGRGFVRPSSLRRDEKGTIWAKAQESTSRQASEAFTVEVVHTALGLWSSNAPEQSTLRLLPKNHNPKNWKMVLTGERPSPSEMADGDRSPLEETPAKRRKQIPETPKVNPAPHQTHDGFGNPLWFEMGSEPTSTG